MISTLEEAVERALAAEKLLEAALLAAREAEEVGDVLRRRNSDLRARLRDLERELVAARIDRMTGKEALLGVCSNLGRPGDGYAAPVAVAWQLAHDALERMNHAKESP